MWNPGIQEKNLVVVTPLFWAKRVGKQLMTKSTQWLVSVKMGDRKESARFVESDNCEAPHGGKPHNRCQSHLWHLWKILRLTNVLWVEKSFYKLYLCRTRNAARHHKRDNHIPEFVLDFAIPSLHRCVGWRARRTLSSRPKGPQPRSRAPDGPLDF